MQTMYIIFIYRIINYNKKENVDVLCSGLLVLRKLDEVLFKIGNRDTNCKFCFISTNSAKFSCEAKTTNKFMFS